MSLRRRLTLLTALAVAVAIAAAAALTLAAVRSYARSQLDDSLRQRAAELRRLPLRVADTPNGLELRLPGPPRRGRDGPFALTDAICVQAVRTDGAVAASDGRGACIAPDLATIALAGRPTGSDILADLGGEAGVRSLSIAAANGYALQLVRSRSELERLLRRVGRILLVVALAGIALAALLGALIARAAVRPVERLTDAVEAIEETGDLSRRVEVGGGSELARLGGRFNAMLGALQRSQAAQQQLVADASHELRTPLTSLRTNIDVLARGTALSEADRTSLLGDLTGQLEEISALVDGLVELSSEPAAVAERVEVRLDELVDDVVARARRLSPQRVFVTTLEPTTIDAVPARVARAVANLIDNAVKWSPPDGAIEVDVASGRVAVRDHGPGIASEDRPHVFDRFYRSASARALPGSGLGLAVVKQVADEHGGSAWIESPDGGGTRAILEFQTAKSDV